MVKYSYTTIYTINFLNIIYNNNVYNKRIIINGKQEEGVGRRKAKNTRKKSTRRGGLIVGEKSNVEYYR
jgi:hypothetical protein